MDKDKILPEFKKAEALKTQKLSMSNHFTEPPSRYSEAGLVKKLESLGIGRPSTYAPTISILSVKDYVVIEKKQLKPNEIAFSVTELLEKNFSDIADSHFTSNLENTLDGIIENKADWQETLRRFYYLFTRKIEEGKNTIKGQKTFTKLDEKYPECGGELAVRKGRYGEFTVRLAFPKRRYSRNLKKDNAEKKEAKKPNGIGVKCPKCKDGEVVGRFSRRGKFYGCNHYPECDFVSNCRPSEEKCEKRGEMMVIKELKKDTFLECLKRKIKKELQ